MRPVKSAERVLAVFELFSKVQTALTVGQVSHGLGIPQQPTRSDTGKAIRPHEGHRARSKTGLRRNKTLEQARTDGEAEIEKWRTVIEAEGLKLDL